MSWLIELTRHFVEQLNLVFRGTSVASHEIQPLGCTNFGNGTSNWWLSTTPQRAISNISVERNSFLWLLSQRGFRENPWKSSATSHNGIFLCTCEKQLFRTWNLVNNPKPKRIVIIPGWEKWRFTSVQCLSELVIFSGPSGRCTIKCCRLRNITTGYSLLALHCPRSFYLIGMLNIYPKQTYSWDDTRSMDRVELNWVSNRQTVKR